MNLQELYKQWCKETGRSGGVLLGSSVKEFFYLALKKIKTMREIIFRGKTEEGIWVYGGYRRCESLSDRAFIIEDGLDWNTLVYGQSVGQYTGLKDKNGNMIFEGDVLKIRGTKRVGQYISYVEYRRAGFALHENKTYLNDDGALIGKGGLEVIGNIHDNPELINKQPG